MRTLGTIFVASLFAFVMFLVVSPRFADRRHSFVEVGTTLINSEYHQVPIAASSLSALKAEYNHGVIAKAAEYMAVFGSNTSVFREIAKIAAGADRECPRLKQVLDLAARSNSNTSRILELAETACEEESGDDELSWQAYYDHMSAIAAFPSVEAAIAAQEGE